MKIWEDSDILEYIDQTMNSKDRFHFENQLKHDVELKTRLNNLRMVDTSIKMLKLNQPGPQLRKNFYAYLEQEKEKLAEASHARIRKINLRWMIGIAAGMLILLTTFFLYRDNQNEILINKLNHELVETKREMFDLLKSESTSHRIQAVNQTYKMVEFDKDIEQTLINTFEHDPSPIVRLTVLEVLSNYADEETLKKLLIENLSKEKDASIQINMIHLMTRIRIPNGVQSLENLMKDNGVLEEVKGEAQMGIFKITSYQKM